MLAVAPSSTTHPRSPSERRLDLDLYSDDDSEDREYVQGLFEDEHAEALDLSNPTQYEPARPSLLTVAASLRPSLHRLVCPGCARDEAAGNMARWAGQQRSSVR